MSNLPPSTALRCHRDGHPPNVLQAVEHEPRLRDDAAPRRGASHHLALECAGIGAALGGTLGVVAATLLVAATVSVLGVGVAGPLAAAFIGALGGAAVGGALGVGLDLRRASRQCDGSRAGAPDGAEPASAP